MATGVAPEPEKKTVVFPGWVMLDRFGRTYCHGDLDAACEEANKKKTAVEVVTSTGHHCFMSFTFSDHKEGISYLDLHWPLEGSAKSESPFSVHAYPYLRATDKDLVLFDISLPSQTSFFDLPPDLFVYTAAGPSPWVQRLPLYIEDRERPFLRSNFTTGILRLAHHRFIVADLNVYLGKKEGSHDCSMLAELCVFNSETEEWKVIEEVPAPQPQDQSNGGQFPILWSTDDVLACDGRFLCWVDYLSGVLLSDFSTIDSPVLHFVPFPGGKEYSEEVLLSRCFAGRFRSVSISHGIMRFVHIDNDFHERIHVDWRRRLERSQGHQQPPQKITIWTLNMRGGNSKFEWEPHREINLDCLWAQCDYRALDIGQRLPQFPVICVEDPDALCCLLRDEGTPGKAWMVMLDMNYAYLRSCTPYINQHPYDAGRVDVETHQNFFSNVPQLPTVFSNYLERPSVIRRDGDKVASKPSKKVKLASTPPEVAKKAKLAIHPPVQCEDLESDDWLDFGPVQVKDDVRRWCQVNSAKIGIDGMKMVY
ncbi:hypothetical protein CFC21_041822 [Triticum aestivum]|uniref:DUF1618 domain-containing protein n=3 Tax=Triticum TaxID=4564 RepID=A0A9R1QJK5_TRITD|nr:uncharacterized protein LOC123070448 [Triticum aestivum]KAF7030235.1 hypothetical protein CFC21_041822 [Triticum aestivum]VAH78599.1 unnamed protein product [Triticum turgidum subsp. durum]